MRTLLILRHAEAVDAGSDRDDHARPLGRLGRDDAPRMGQYLAGLDLQPELVLCSTATRARETIDALAEAAGFDCPIDHDDALYLAAAEVVIDALREAPETCRCLMVVGHNPGLGRLIHVLTDETEPMPTCAVAHLSVQVETWADLVPQCGTLEAVHRPRGLWRAPSDP